MPTTLNAVFFNGMSASNVSETKTLSIMRKAAASGADILFGAECSNITTAHPLGDGWTVLHVRETAAKAGSFLAVRNEHVKVISWDLKMAAKAALGIRDRYIVVATIVAFANTPQELRMRVVAGHAPPKRSWGTNFWHWLEWIRSVRAVDAALIGADFNRLARAVGPALSRRTRMLNIVGFALRSSLASVTSKPIQLDLDADHPGVLIRIARPAG